MRSRVFLLPWLKHLTERNLSIHTCWHHDFECSSDLQLRYRETASRVGALVQTFCAHLTFVGDEKDEVAAVRGDKHAKDELGDENAEVSGVARQVRIHTNHHIHIHTETDTYAHK